MSGYEAIEKLKMSEHKNMPVIFITNNENTADKQEGIFRSAAGYIRKPFSNEALVAAVSKFFA